MKDVWGLNVTRPTVPPHGKLEDYKDDHISSPFDPNRLSLAAAIITTK